MKKLISALFAVVSITFAAGVSAETTLNNSQKVVALLKSIETGDRAAVAYINPNKYIQHNLGVADGLGGFAEVLKALPKGSARANTVRVFQDGDFVVAHTEYNFFGPKTGFDIFRFENGLITEHWDNLTEKTEPNPSGRTQTDGETGIVDLDKTEANKKLVANFVDTILKNGKMDQIGRFIGPATKDYLQHNSHVADGLQGLGSALEAMAKQGIHMVYEKNHLVLGQGNFVLTVSEGRFGPQHVAYYDLFRVQDGKIVEHWDVIEEIPARSAWKNDNGKFGF